MLAVTFRKDDTSLSLVQCECPLKKSLIQLYTWSGISSCAIFSIRVEWHTESNAFEKSRAITCTKLLVPSKSHTV